jgi:hypothetical protein
MSGGDSSHAEIYLTLACNPSSRFFACALFAHARDSTIQVDNFNDSYATSSNAPELVRGTM